jgi:hypothetical protein
MRSNLSTVVAAAFFLALALTNVVLMLEASSSSRSAKMKPQLIAAHRVAGYLFVILFCIMAYSMSQRLAGSGITGHLPTYLVVHIVLALSRATPAAEITDRTTLQAELFDPDGTRNDDCRDFIRPCVGPSIFHVSSFDELSKPRIKSV